MIPEEGKFIVDFWAPWCGPCKMMMPVLEKYSAEDDAVEVIKINIDEEADIAAQFGIRSIPTFMYIEDGVIKNKTTGALSIQQLKELAKN